MWTGNVTPLAVVALTTGVVAGATVQRLTGLGFTLVASPFLVLAFGAWYGVSLMYLLGTATCMVAAWQTKAIVPKALAARLCVAAAVGVLPGVGLAWVANERALGVGVAAATIFACLTLLLVPSLRVRDRTALQYGAGFSCGALGGVAGVGGPPLVIYGAIARVDSNGLVAAMQLTFCVVGLEAMFLRWVLSGSAVPSIPLPVWLAMAAAVALGDRLGAALRGRLSEGAARYSMLTLALVGSSVLLWQSLA